MPYQKFSLICQEKKNIEHFQSMIQKMKKVEQQIISREESYLITTEHHEMPMTSFTTKWKLSFLAKIFLLWDIKHLS